MDSKEHKVAQSELIYHLEYERLPVPGASNVVLSGISVSGLGTQTFPYGLRCSQFMICFRHAPLSLYQRKFLACLVLGIPQ